jgi:hypothetical protein
MTDQASSTKSSKDGTSVLFTVSEDVVVNHVLAIPRGAVHGEVVEDRKAGVVRKPRVDAQAGFAGTGWGQLSALRISVQVRGASKEKPTANDVATGAYYGALAGGVVAGRTNALPTRKTVAEDRVAGAAVGLARSRRRLWYGLCRWFRSQPSRRWISTWHPRSAFNRGVERKRSSTSHLVRLAQRALFLLVPLYISDI